MMFQAKYQWNLLYREKISSHDQLNTVLAENRGLSVSEWDQFLNGEIPLHDPFLFNDMEKVVKRIKMAKENDEYVVIYGDYDVDGVTGTTILYKTLQSLGIKKLEYYIPNRFTEGYGPNLERFRAFVEAGVNLIITVDNGIAGITEAEYLHQQKVDYIITDHHDLKTELPKAYAIIHPKRPSERYPFKDLSGCGVAFKVAWALLGHLPEAYLDLAALGTQADIVSALGENRTLLKRGIQQLVHTEHLGLKALQELLGMQTIDEYSLGFIFGPRLNAAGRMESASLAVELLICDDPETAFNLALQLEELNQNRKQLIDAILAEAIRQIETDNLLQHQVLIVHHPDWHEGVLGIIASRLVDTYQKPTIVLTLNEGVYKGSARSTPTYPLIGQLNQVANLFEKFGGHQMAAGLSIKPENIPLLQAALAEIAIETAPNELVVEAELDLSLVDDKSIELLTKLKPFGAENHEPRFLFSQVQVANLRTMGADGKHLRFMIGKVPVVGFNYGYLINMLSEMDQVNLIGTLEANTFMNQTTYQIKLIDIACPQLQIFDWRHRYVNLDVLRELDCQKIYFEYDHGVDAAVKYDENLALQDEILIIDIPNDVSAIKRIMQYPTLSRIYLWLKEAELLSMEHLLTREKMAKIYAIYRHYKQFHIDDRLVIQDLKRLGFDKSIHSLAIQVFFELNFVIIEDIEVTVVEKPQRKDLSESPTYRHLQATIQMKELLTLSGTEALKKYLFSLRDMEE